MDFARSYGKTLLQLGRDNKPTITCSIISKRLAYLIIQKGDLWRHPMFKLRPFSLTFDYVVIGAQPSLGQLIVVYQPRMGKGK